MRCTTCALALFLPLLACDAPRRPGAARSAPPQAEFLLATSDSTFWVRTTATGVRTHGAPLFLANYGGRFYEIFVADDDRSYSDALLVGQRLYRRDLADGDSVMLFADTIVPRIALAYARAHPRERPLDPDEDVRENPQTRATAEFDVLDVHGPYLSFQYHADVAQPGLVGWHTTRHGVLDLRSGHAVRIVDLFDDTVASRVMSEGRREFLAAVESLRERGGAGDSRARRAADALSRFQFDDRSFALAALDTAAAVEFAPTGRGSEEAEGLPPLAPVAAGSAPWWSELRPSLPSTEGSGAIDRWRRSAIRESGYDVVAKYDSLGETARIVLSDGGRREWPVASVAAPVQRIFWLDRTPIDSLQRRGLVRAFSEASLYDETTRTVHDPRRSGMRYAFAADGSPIRDPSRRIAPSTQRKLPRSLAARRRS